MSFRNTDLRNFVAAADGPTMSTAARRLGITQPSLSQSIQRLEADLSVKLFYRSRSGIQLTPSGRLVLDKGRSALSGLQDVELACNPNLPNLGRRLVLGCHPVVASSVLPRTLARMGQSHPDCRFQIQEATSREIQLQVQAGQIDVGVVMNPMPVPDLVIRKLGFDEVCVWSKGKPGARLICQTNMFQTQYILRKWNAAPTEIIEIENFELAARLTAAGIGYGVIPERAIRLLGLDLQKHDELPIYKDAIALIHRPEFGRQAVEKEVLRVLVTTLQGAKA